MNLTTNGTPRPSYTARDYVNIRADLIAFVAQTRPDLLPDFQNDQGLGPFLLDLVALVGDNTSFAVDSAALAVFVATSMQYGAALRFARSIGYVSRSATSATAVVKATIPASLSATGGTIAAGQAIPGPSGTSFFLPGDATVAVGASDVTLTLTEGVPYTETFDPTNLSRFTVRSTNSVVADASWTVFVGDPDNPANEWDMVDNVAMEIGATNTFEIQFDEVGRLIVQFGDGTSGAIPADSITLGYRTTQGAFGNVALLALSGSMTASLTGLGTTVSLSLTNSTSPAVGGDDRETLTEMQVNIPAFIRNSGKLTTIADFDSAPRAVGGVAASYAALDLSSYRGNIVDINIWSSSQVTFVAEGDDPPNRTATTYTQYQAASTTLATSVRNYLTSRTAVTVFPNVLKPPVAWADLYLTHLAYDARFSSAVVHQNVTRAVVSVFQNSDGFSVRLSDLYTAISAAVGVRYFTLDRIVFELTKKRRATGTVVFFGSVNPANGNMLTINDGDTTTIFEFTTSSPASGHIAVHLATAARDTLLNLVAAINYNTKFITATASDSSTPTANLTQKQGGAGYNLTVTKTGSVLAVTGMSGGNDTPSVVREDHRQQSGTDPWLPGTYAAGEPFVPGGGAWQDGGILPYMPMTDLVIPIDRYATAYYDAATAYNHEIIYDSLLAGAVLPQVINLRRLVIDMQPVA